MQLIVPINQIVSYVVEADIMVNVMLEQYAKKLKKYLMKVK